MSNLDVLYELSVTAPVAKAWRLAGRPLDENVVYAGSPAYQGLVLSGPVSGSAGIGGSGGAEVTITLANHLGSYGSGGGRRKRFADWFSEPVTGYGEPYDLHGATLTVAQAFHGLTVADVVSLGTYSLIPGTLEATGDMPGQPSVLRMTFGKRTKLDRRLPNLRYTQGFGATPTVFGRPLPVVFGPDVQIAAQPINEGGALAFTVCESPGDTPVDLTGVSLVLQDPRQPENQALDYSLPVVSNPIKTNLPSLGGVVSIRTAGDTVIHCATPFIMPGAAREIYLIDKVELEIQNFGNVDGGPASISGPATVTIERDERGAPGGLIDPAATKSINVNTIATTAFGAVAFRTWTFDQKPVGFAGDRCWLVCRYTKNQDDSDVNVSGGFRWMHNSFSVDFASALIDIDSPGDGTGWQYLPSRPVAFSFKLHAVAYTFEDSVFAAGGEGPRVAQIIFDSALNSGVVVQATLNGMKDDGSGTYTGTAAALITNPADAVRWLLRHASGLGLSVDDVDEDSLDAARAALVTWPGVREALDISEPAEVWLARVARMCKSAIHEGHDGTVAMVVRGVAKTPVRYVQPWEHGPIALRSLAASTPITVPVSKVELFAQRDPMALDNPDFGRSRIADWNDYGVISAAQTDPTDAIRQAQAIVLDARYGTRGNSGAQSGAEQEVTELIAGWFVSSTALPHVLADLWDTLSVRPDVFDVLEVQLPRYALPWRLTDHFTLESWDFPGFSSREQPRTDLWDYPWDDGPFLNVEWYTARRGRFEVREVIYDPVGGIPARVTATLVGWETP